MCSKAERTELIKGREPEDPMQRGVREQNDLVDLTSMYSKAVGIIKHSLFILLSTLNKHHSTVIFFQTSSRSFF